MPADSRQDESFAAAVSDVSERVSVLIREEIELAKAETMEKVSSLARGAIAVAVGAAFGFFALIFALSTLAWGLSGLLTNSAGSIWVGFAIVMGILILLALCAFLFAWRKLRVGAPTPSSPSGSGPAAIVAERPEVAVGAAFAGGLVLALILKRLAH